MGSYGVSSAAISAIIASQDAGTQPVVARKRAAEKYGPVYGSPGSAVVIGDTQRDVEAAQLGGARLLAVACGVHPAEELLAAGAPHVFHDLSATADILAYLFPA